MSSVDIGSPTSHGLPEAARSEQPEYSPSMKENFREEKVYIDRYPAPAGASTGSHRQSDFATYEASIQAEEENPYAPFKTQMEWEIAKWAKLYGAGANSLTKLLSIPGVSSTKTIQD